MDESDCRVIAPECFRARVKVFVCLTIDVTPEGNIDLPIRAASARASTAAYEKVREAFSTYQIEKAPLVEVLA